MYTLGERAQFGQDQPGIDIQYTLLSQETPLN